MGEKLNLLDVSNELNRIARALDFFCVQDYTKVPTESLEMLADSLALICSNIDDLVDEINTQNNFM